MGEIGHCNNHIVRVQSNSVGSGTYSKTYDQQMYPNSIRKGFHKSANISRDMGQLCVGTSVMLNEFERMPKVQTLAGGWEQRVKTAVDILPDNPNFWRTALR